ncbi:hypothetical protein CONPUDRAFT_86111 [Coniophora puteana RWD-64-598 SS2]|uniref:Uncharacterized protein n=1 Tax=Coniophora puteana (strain RWD-64-598) TaxID=741705 RepID=R7SFH9_CONPW|nr:uncharacterized protein CONPUDRAFT_86111 [Coniophora puteana RWD-64-598 SS2]EIW73834.1 hypothetical protein CONPUDRAFT_86111 [Coniophora puteana RWD-64-598 SS2]
MRHYKCTIGRDDAGLSNQSPPSFDASRTPSFGLRWSPARECSKSPSLPDAKAPRPVTLLGTRLGRQVTSLTKSLTE